MYLRSDIYKITSKEVCERLIVWWIIQHVDSQRTTLEKWITFSKVKAHEQGVNE